MKREHRNFLNYCAYGLGVVVFWVAFVVVLAYCFKK